MQETSQPQPEIIQTVSSTPLDAVTNSLSGTGGVSRNQKSKKYRLLQITSGIIILLLMIGAVLFFPRDKYLPDEEHPPGPDNPLGRTEPNKPANSFIVDDLILDFQICEPQSYVLENAQTNTTVTYQVHGLRPIQSTTNTSDYCALSIESMIGNIVNPYTCLVPVAVGEFTLENQFFGMDPELLQRYCREVGGYQQEIK